MTHDEIESAKTPAGGFTRNTLAGWGVPWPPPKSWRKRLLKEECTNPTPTPPTQPAVDYAQLASAILDEQARRARQPTNTPTLTASAGGAADTGKVIVVSVPGYDGPEPGSAEFDSSIHGLLAPPKVTYRKLK